MSPHARLLQLAFVVFLLVSGTAAGPAAYAQSAPTAPNTSIWLSPPEVVIGPSDVADNPYHTLQDADALRSYVGNGATKAFIGGSLETLRPLPSPAIGPGTSFDSCGAWLNGAWRDGNTVRGWYHAETACDYPSTHKSVAYAESHDGGNTFVKPNYPFNQVLSAPPGLSSADDDEGDQRVIRVGDYLYMYFIASRDWQVRLARSRVADGGRPGTWYKYYNGSFSEPGLGGLSTPLDPTGALTRAWVSRNTYLNRYLGFSYAYRPGYSEHPQGFAGYGFTVSGNGISGWQTLPYLLLSSEGVYWGRTGQSRELIDYLSLISPYGDSDDIGDAFWLYYMYLNPGDDFANHRYLLRRNVHMRFTSSSSPTDLVPRIALVNYTKPGDAWFTTTSTDSRYTPGSVIGYLFTDQIPGVKPVFDCYAPDNDDHYPMLDANDCGGHGVLSLRRMGWIAQASFPGGRPVYVCWDASNTDHFLSLGRECEGKAFVSQLGYLAEPPTFAPLPYVALSGYYDAAAEDSWATTVQTSGSYAFQGRLGYLWTAQQPGSLSLYDCYIDFWHDHMIDIYPSCGNAQLLRLLGFISIAPVPNSVRLYRCWDAEKTNHFVSVDPACEGKQTEWPIGYAARVPTFDERQRIYLPSLLRE